MNYSQNYNQSIYQSTFQNTYSIDFYDIKIQIYFLILFVYLYMMVIIISLEWNNQMKMILCLLFISGLCIFVYYPLIKYIICKREDITNFSEII